MPARLSVRWRGGCGGRWRAGHRRRMWGRWAEVGVVAGVACLTHDVLAGSALAGGDAREVGAAVAARAGQGPVMLAGMQRGWSMSSSKGQHGRDGHRVVVIACEMGGRAGSAYAPGRGGASAGSEAGGGGRPERVGAMPSRKASDQGHKEKRKENLQASHGRSRREWNVRFGRLAEPDSLTAAASCQVWPCAPVPAEPVHWYRVRTGRVVHAVGPAAPLGPPRAGSWRIRNWQQRTAMRPVGGPPPAHRSGMIRCQVEKPCSCRDL